MDSVTVAGRDIAEWKFLYLKVIMSEAAISVRDMAADAGVGEASVVKARGGKCLKKSSQVKLFSVVENHERCAHLPPLKNRLIVHKDVKEGIELLTLIKAGF